MSERIHALAQHLLGKPSVDECSLEEIQHLAKRYPYFAPAQFLLLQKLKATGSPDYEAQQRKAVLYYPDPLQFDFFISSEKFLVDDTAFLPPADEKETNPDVVLPSTTTLAEEQAFLQQELAEEAVAAESIIPSTVEAMPLTDDEKTSSEPLQFMEPDKVKEPETVETPEPAVLGGSPLKEKQDTTLAVEVDAKENNSIPDESIICPTASNAVEELPSIAAPDLTNNKEESPDKNQQAPSKGSSEGETLAFEPFHTVDYFASQGIKISVDELSKDKLSKQLRSFTDWLKMMKRLPAANVEQTPKSTAETSVENMASHSVEGSDVVTEAMAEVWAKQGANGKAIETYNKLSLLNPSKKAYFAAKIENLRGS